MNKHISSLLSTRYGTPVLLGVVAFAAELGRGYIVHVIQKRSVVVVPAEPVIATAAPEENVESDLEEAYMKEFEQMLDEAEEEARQELEAPSRVNIFLNNDDGWSYEYEAQHRTPDAPYVIHADEFINDEMGYKQKTVTYYEGDDIMADEADVPIYNWSALMGELKWGHGSKDKNVVYIRNEREHKEWEVLLHSGSYEVEVQGLRIEGGELRHSQHRVPKFRGD